MTELADWEPKPGDRVVVKSPDSILLGSVVTVAPKSYTVKLDAWGKQAAPVRVKKDAHLWRSQSLFGYGYYVYPAQSTEGTRLALQLKRARLKNTAIRVCQNMNPEDRHSVAEVIDIWGRLDETFDTEDA